MLSFDTFWTFPFGDSLVAAPPDWEGLLLLNPTAAWLWRHFHLPNLPKAFAQHFEIPLAQAQSDISQTLRLWDSFRPAERLPPSSPPAQYCHSSTVRILQTTFLLRFETSEIASEVVPRLASIETPAAKPDFTLAIHQDVDGFTLARDSVPLLKEPLVAGARVQLLIELTRLAKPVRDFTAILHAGAIGTSDSTLILAGASRSGKSTLCAGLIAEGWRCYSDDSAPLDEKFHVTAMPFSLMLREASWPLFLESARYPTFQRYGDNVRFIPSHITPDDALPVAPVRALVFVDYQPAASGAALYLVDPFEALVALQQAGCWIEHTRSAISTFLAWLARLPIYRLTYSNLESTLPLLNNGLIRQSG